jgi:hypothetical protein
VHEAERRERERERVRHRERGDRQQQRARARHDQDQGEQKEQVIDAERDVLDAVHEIGAQYAERAAGGADLHPGPRRVRDARPLPAVQQRDAHQHVGDAELESDELDAPAGETLGPRVDLAPLDQRIRQLLHAGNGEVPHAVRQLQHDREPHAREHRRAPQHVVATGSRLLDLEIGGPDLVGACGASDPERDEQRGDRAEVASRAHCGTTTASGGGSITGSSFGTTTW